MEATLTTVERQYPNPFPKGCRLTQKQWQEYLCACQRGRLFFIKADGPVARVNRWFQTKILQRPYYSIAVVHVGVIDHDRWAIEALAREGPTRDSSVDRYLFGNRTLIIADLRSDMKTHEINAGIEAIVQKMRLKRMKYDWVSLITFGALNAPGAMICSELATLYRNEALRLRPNEQMLTDNLPLPQGLLDECLVVWKG